MADRSPRRVLTVLTALAIATAVGWACLGPAPPPRSPTVDRVAASPRNIGIPYGPWVLYRGEDRFVAFRVTAASGLGNRIEFEWAATPAGSTEFSEVHRGRGEAEDRSAVARLDLGPLLLDWSRGSGQIGWLYWPKGDFDFAVCATTFDDLADIRPGSDRLRWYTRDMFE